VKLTVFELLTARFWRDRTSSLMGLLGRRLQGQGSDPCADFEVDPLLTFLAGHLAGPRAMTPSCRRGDRAQLTAPTSTHGGTS